MAGYAGGTAAADIVQFRRYVGEPGTATYTDAALIAVLTKYPLPDVAGEWPLLTSGSANTAWTGTYDHAAAAADIWDEKATPFVGAFDFTADGATFHKSQVYAQHSKEARKWRSRRAIGSHELLAYPAPTMRDNFVFNINDPYE
jgi:hypothetical protein